MNNSLNVRIIPFALLIFFAFSASAQDIHFSQIHSVPQMLNPAMSAVMEPYLRISNNYRNQWRQIDYPYNSNYLSLDVKQNILGRPIGIGAFLLHDQSSSLYLTADKFYFSLSHSFFFNNQQFVIGLQPGLVMKSVDRGAITFGSQFDSGSEQFNANLPSGEDFLGDKMNYFDLNIGMLWRAKINKIYHSAGISVSHVNRPVESFYSENDSVRLPMKYTFHGSLAIPLSAKFDVFPLYMYTRTYGASEFIGGAITAYSPNNPVLPVKKIYVLSQFRMDPFETVDAIILGAGAKFLSLDLCISYDLTVSSLSKASRFQRAFELSLIFEINRHKSESSTEPCFML